MCGHCKASVWFDQFKEDMFDKIEKGWEMPGIDEEELREIYSMTREYIGEILEHADNCCCGNYISDKELEQKIKILFKLNMIAGLKTREDYS